MVTVSAGCISSLVDTPRDVTRSSDKWGGYRPGEVYELIRDVEMTRDDLPVLRTTDPAATYVLRAGTRVRIDRFVAHTAENEGVYVFATILDGPYQGKLVDAHDLSIPGNSAVTRSVAGSPDPSKMRLVATRS